jgi:hypothetical protein
MLPLILTNPYILNLLLPALSLTKKYINKDVPARTPFQLASKLKA